MTKIASEPLADDPRRVAALLGGEKVLGRTIRSLADMREAVERGLPKAALMRIARFITPEATGQRALMHRLVPEPTLRRRGRRLNLVGSERTERLARLTALAEAVWGDEADARSFMTSPHPMLDGKAPAEMAVTDLGAREVETILKAIAFGLPV